MPEIEIKDRNNKKAGKINLPDEIFGIKASEGVMHDSVVNFLANQRQGTHATKTKGLVSGGGRKPWKQKHTGRARAGSSRSPLWRSGGTAFGPQPRDYSYSIPRKVKHLALKNALSAKLADGEIMLIDDLSISKPSTKDMAAIIKTLGFEGQSLLIVLPENNKNIKLSARNIAGVHVACASDLNAYTVIAHSRLLITKGAVAGIKGTETA
ncbi:MAG: 50S ribosomal protein L4 [Nitrospirae bacterium CG_4_10_14_3_um_filter_44_29]|nr:50S ribosomal protein L4 [Nitrospirota bacterium]OIO29979.1 MAG: 50S ribosomal protein L4 [Nitrospirae bacterium CG1_02_44_142]PIP69566.1 MAG: 50S ribosomal protein L4 [Nitrospirae bacterium CG22_combo_CG10-13_8_21_14_all_44_11]PIV41888.1 MAG: 50S ribosomal protein L4 [Nitrospirae bacterium CG02_land_8_20_14_3_00_44_33]PIV66457.1 MAG: 50S ribosomal protein L4 [Nitrospirae bacterium CG01_land_8_20_14_3_00_44_22]PIW89492.1 MAG: 50S ribosomal protein L4 [Nitrospirae bacterium CG_4_8_14_3_um_fi